MHIVGLVAENYKRLRVVEITPKGRVVQITGKNGQGKTSVLDAIWAALVGAKAIPEKPVRKGGEKARIKLDLGEFVVTRTIAPSGTHTLTVENGKGVKCQSPQAILDALMGSLTFDPLEFISMKPAQQVETLRQVAAVELDIDTLNAENKKDFEDRKIINREVDRLAGEVASITVQDGLPKEKLDEKAILERLNHAGEENRKAQEMFRHRQELAQQVEKAKERAENNKVLAQTWINKIKEIEKELAFGKQFLEDVYENQKDFDRAIEFATAGLNEVPELPLVDVAELTQELQTVQLTNREIDKRTKRSGLEEKLRDEKRKAEELTRAMEARDEKKRTALQNAKMPIEGLSFDENQVMFNGIPIEQLGEAEQIRVSTSIAMAANPKLRILRILHGEAMDDDSLKILAEMAEANDFQIWMAKVDSSGKVGIVMEDGGVKTENED